jgi:hypothetical protein
MEWGFRDFRLVKGLRGYEMRMVWHITRLLGLAQVWNGTEVWHALYY